MTVLEKALDDALRDATRQCQRLGYNPTLMIQMIAESAPSTLAGVCSTRARFSEGFTRLWELKRLDLTVEAIALRPEFAPLFTAEQLAMARERLAELGFHVPGHTGPSPSTAPIGPMELSREPSIETVSGPLSSHRTVARPGEGKESSSHRIGLP